MPDLDLNLDQVRARFREYAEAAAYGDAEQLAAKRCANDIPALLNRLAELAAEVERLRAAWDGGTSRTEWGNRLHRAGGDPEDIRVGAGDIGRDRAERFTRDERAILPYQRKGMSFDRSEVVHRTVTTWPDGGQYIGPWTEVAP